MESEQAPSQNAQKQIIRATIQPEMGLFRFHLAIRYSSVKTICLKSQIEPVRVNNARYLAFHDSFLYAIHTSSSTSESELGYEIHPAISSVRASRVYEIHSAEDANHTSEVSNSSSSGLKIIQRSEKETEERNGEKQLQKERVAAAPRSPSGSPVLSEEEEKEEQEEQPDLMALRIEYTTLSHQLAQLDVNKQAGQWANSLSE